MTEEEEWDGKERRRKWSRWPERIALLVALVFVVIGFKTLEDQGNQLEDQTVLNTQFREQAQAGRTEARQNLCDTLDYDHAVLRGLITAAPQPTRLLLSEPGQPDKVVTIKVVRTPESRARANAAAAKLGPVDCKTLKVKLAPKKGR